MAAIASADFETPATRLRRMILQNQDPNAPAPDPTVSQTSNTAPLDAAPFADPTVTKQPTSNAAPTAPTEPVVTVPSNEPKVAAPPPDVAPANPPAQAASPNNIDQSSIDAVNGFYQKYLGRAANPNDAQTWLSGGYGWGTDLATIENAIRNSDEAQQYRARTGGGGGGGGGGRPSGGSINDPNYLSQLIDWAATQPGVNPSVINDKAYWMSAAPRFNGDENYFVQRMFTPEGAPEGAPQGGWTGTPSAQPTSAASPTNDAFAAYLKNLTDQQAAAQAQRDAVRNLIMTRLQAASSPVNESDIGISQPLAAARDEAQRAQQTERTALAERLYAQGGGALNSNALTQAIQQSAEQNAGGLSQLRAGLITKAYDDKRTEMLSLLQQALASGDTQTAQLLQAQIAALNAAIQREGMGISLAEFLANLNARTVGQATA